MIKAKTFETTTKNMAQTIENLEMIDELGAAINRVQQQNYYRDLRTPIIAGGSVRDTFFGLCPKDYDVFFDVSHLEEDERDDFVLMYMNDLLKEARKSEKLAPDLQGAVVESLESVYDGTRPDQFSVYQTSWTFADEWPEVPMRIQAIGRTDKRLSQDDPLPFLDDFDYSAVKVLYDPKSGELRSSKEFDDFLEKRIIEASNPQTVSRIRSWMGRFYPKPPFEFRDLTPTKKVDDWAAFTTATSAVPTTWKIVRNNPDPFGEAF